MAKQIRVVVAAMDRFVDQIIRKVVLDIVANLQSAPSTGHGTPVDTGWARSNWVPVVGPAQKGTVGSPENVDDSESKSATARIALGYKFSQGAVTISNNVPYIIILNFGGAGRPARGFVQNSITKAIKQDLATIAGAAG